MRHVGRSALVTATPPQDPRRRRTWVGIAVVFVVGAGAGTVVQPLSSAVIRNLTGLELLEPDPLDSALWTTMTGQYQMLDKIGSGPAIVYLGDSITDRMRVDEMLTFEGGRIFNRSIAGDTTLGMLRRIDQGVPGGIEVCFVLVGINDLLRGAAPSGVADRIQRIATRLVHRGVRHVVVESILPSTKVDERHVRQTNERLRVMPQRVPLATFLDLFVDFSRNGQLNVSLYADGVHLNERGMLVRLRREVAHLESVLPAVAGRIAAPALAGQTAR